MDRRGWLKLGLGAATLLALGGGMAALLGPGVHAGKLTGSGRRVLRHAARGLLDGTLPAAAEQQATALEAFLERADALVAALPRHTQNDLSRLLALLDSTAGRRALARIEPGWEQASAADLQRSFQVMRTSSWQLAQQAYQALHDVVGAAYFSDPGTWSLLGYPGPDEL